ncbi:MAG: radical SAM protein, partial [Methanoregula sp.]|nr:radical SAM protein [Methanoregula sp.]
MTTAKVPTLLSDVLDGHRLNEKEAELLLNTRGSEVLAILSAADQMRERRVGDTVTYVRNQNLHVTNICKNLCGFCGFGRKVTDEGAYCHDKAGIQAQATLAYERKVTEICLLSGVHPGFTLDTFVDLMHWVQEAAPGVHIHAFSPDEVDHAAHRGEIPTPEVLARLKAEGLGTIQGTAAEILVDSVRKVICPRKVSTADWVRIIKEAHGMGMKSTATIMYGSYETAADQV